MSSPQKLTAVEDDLALRVWDGDETVLPDLLQYCAGAIETVIACRPGMKSIAEDIVAEAILLFWEHRRNYDGKRPLKNYLYVIAENLANQFAAGRLKWQKARRQEKSASDGWLQELAKPVDARVEADDSEQKQTPLFQALRKALDKLSPLHRDVLEAYAAAGEYPLDAGQLGIELGRKHNNGNPYPAGTIRQYKKRAKEAIVLEMRKLNFDLTGARA